VNHLVRLFSLALESLAVQEYRRKFPSKVARYGVLELLAQSLTVQLGGFIVHTALGIKTCGVGFLNRSMVF